MMMRSALLTGPAKPSLEFDLLEVLRLLWNAKFRILLATFVGTVLFLVIGYLLPPTYVAQGEVVVRAEASVAPDVERSFNATAVNEAVVATERSVLSAQGLLTRVSNEVAFPPDLMKPGLIARVTTDVRTWLHAKGWGPPVPEVSEDMVKAEKYAALRTSVGTGVEKGSSVIAVTAATRLPEFSAAVVNRVLDDYMQERIEAQQSVARNVERALQERLKQATEKIGETQDRIGELLQQPSVIEGSEIPQTQRNITLLSSQLTAANQNLFDRKAAYDAAVRARADAGKDPARLGELLDNGTQSSSDLRRLFAQRQEELAGLAAQYGPGHPSRVAAQNQVSALGARLSGEAARVVAQRKGDLDSAQSVVDKLKAAFSEARRQGSRDSTAGIKLARERDSLANLQRTSGAIEDRLIAVASQPLDPNARILTRAIPPLKPMYPNKPLLGGIGLAVGLVGSSSLVVLLGFLRRVRSSVVEQAEMFEGPLLGSIPRLKRFGRNEGLVDGLRRLRTEGTQKVRAALQGAALELDHALHTLDARVVTIASALPQEGKSTMAVAMGLHLARTGRRVLLIQCDMHEGRARYFQNHHAVATLDKLTIVSDEQDSLEVLELPTTMAPIDFLASDGFRTMLDKARAEYDVILCDAPPLLSVPDTMLVARRSDAILLVREFKREIAVEEVSELSRRIGAIAKPVCGVLVTKVDSSDIGYSAFLGYGTAGNRTLALNAR